MSIENLFVGMGIALLVFVSHYFWRKRQRQKIHANQHLPKGRSY